MVNTPEASRFFALCEEIKDNLDDHRYKHSIGVCYTAASLAMRYGTDIDNAMTAGILHDCAKCISGKEALEILNKEHITLNDTEKANPALLHAKLGGVLARKKYIITDEEIISSIICHTTGKPEMSMLEKIIYIADFIEPGRKWKDELYEIRKLAFTDIDLCVYKTVELSITILKGKNTGIDTITFETYDYYKELIEKR